MAENEKQNRGFRSMDPERGREIAAMGGRAAHVAGVAHEWTPETAASAGAKGGRLAHERGTAHRFTPEEAREAGRKGGAKRMENRRLARGEAS